MDSLILPRVWAYRLDPDQRNWNRLDMDWFHRFQEGDEAFPPELGEAIPMALVSVTTRDAAPLGVVSIEFSYLHVDSNGRTMPWWDRPVAREGVHAINNQMMAHLDGEESARNRFIGLQYKRDSYWEPSVGQLEALRLDLVEHNVRCDPQQWQEIWQNEQARRNR